VKLSPFYYFFVRAEHVIFDSLHIPPPVRADFNYFYSGSSWWISCPWSVFSFLSSDGVPFGLRAITVSRVKAHPVRALLVIWCLFVFVFFSRSLYQARGPMLPILPELAASLRKRFFEETLQAPDAPGGSRRALAV